MSELRALYERVGGLFHKRRRDRAFAEELESHIQMHIEDNLRSGMNDQEARRNALIKLGGIEPTKELYRGQRGLPVLEALLKDLFFGFRLLRKNLGFAAVAILTLALGIGANTAIFSVVNAVLLKPLPYKDPEKLVYVWSTLISQGVSTTGSAGPDFREWRDRNHAFTDMAAFGENNFDLSMPGQEPSRLRGVQVTPDLFPLLGINPSLGRNFRPEEEQWQHHEVVLLSFGFWQANFGGDKNVLGRTLQLDGQDYSIVGVMPRGMQFLLGNSPPADLWTPLSYAPGDNLNTRRNHYLDVIARLKPGVSVAQAQAEMSGIAMQLEKEFPSNKGLGARIVPARQQLVGSVRSSLLILLGAVSFVLLIACINVANLMLAWATAREQEFAIRSALGASRRRLLSQLMLEGGLVALLGGLGGIIIAACGMKVFESFVPSDLPRFNPIGINREVFLYTLVISLLTSLVCAIAPAIHASRGYVQESLREGGRRGNAGHNRRRLRSLLVVSEVGLALLLLTGAGLLIRTFGALRHTDPGFSPAHILTMNVRLSPKSFPAGHEDEAIQFFESLVGRVDALPGVKRSGMTTTLPLGFGGWVGKDVDLPDHAPPTALDKVPLVRFQLSSPGYMPAIGARLIEGRFFTNQDVQQAPAVAIVNETFARQLLPKEDPVGKFVRMTAPLDLLPPDARAPNLVPPVRTIVAVIADMKDSTMNRSALPTVYAPYYQHRNESWGSYWTLAVNTTNDEPLNLVGAVRDQFHSLVPDLPVAEITTMDQLLARSLSGAQFSMLLLTLFAALALVLSVIGIYGVMAYAVVRQTHDIGVRMALGSQRITILRTVVQSGMQLTLFGVGFGITGALVLTRFISSQLYGVSPTDPLTFGGVAILLIAVALLACYVPARRATRVNPMAAIRHE